LLEGVIETIDEFYSENLGEDIKRACGKMQGEVL